MRLAVIGDPHELGELEPLPRRRPGLALRSWEADLCRVDMEAGWRPDLGGRRGAVIARRASRAGSPFLENCRERVRPWAEPTLVSGEAISGWEQAIEHRWEAISTFSEAVVGKFWPSVDFFGPSVCCSSSMTDLVFR